MQSIDAVVFDVGNVLIRWDPHNLYKRMGLTRADVEAIMRETRLAEINHRQLDAGSPFAATLAELASQFPHHAELIEAFDRRWPEMLAGAIETNVAVMRSLQAAGVPVHGISNFNREKFDIARGLFPFLDEFDDLVVSGDVGLVKPDREIFELLITRADLTPERTVVIDDSAANIETARQLGFAVIQFDEQESDLAAELSRMGLRFR